MTTTPNTIETLIRDLREGRDLTAVVQDLSVDHRGLMAKWYGICMETILPDVERASKRLSEKIPHHASMFEDVCFLMRDANPRIVDCDYANSSKRYRRTAEMMYWAMYGYYRFMLASAESDGRKVEVDEGEAMSTLTRALDALTLALRMVRFATRDDKPEACARLANVSCPRFVRLIGRARDSATHVAAVENGGCYTGAFDDDGKVLPVGPAAREMFDHLREVLIGILTEATQTPAATED